MWSRWLREDVYRQWLMHDDRCQPTGICHPIEWPRWHLTRGPQATSLTWETSSNQLTVITAKLWLYQNVSILQNWMLCIHKTLSPLQPRTLWAKFGWNTLVSKHSSVMWVILVLTQSHWWDKANTWYMKYVVYICFKISFAYF